MQKEIDLTREWILRSGIQNTEGPGAGGFNSWFDPREKNYSYVYSEITGYGITTLLMLKDLLGDEEFLRRARLAAKWLASYALHPCGGVRTRDYYRDMEGAHLYSFDSENMYAFDNGMVAYGLANLYKETGKAEYLDFAEHIAGFLLEKMMKPDGMFWAVYNPRTGEKEDLPQKWSSQSGSYHAKLALVFTDLYDVTGKDLYKSVALRLCRRCMDLQQPSGRFITSRGDKSTHLHPHFYSAEGLLYAGVHFGVYGFIESAAKAVKWALDNQREDGGIPKFFDGETFNRNYRSDILAQALRLGLVLYSMGRLGEEYRVKLDKLKEALLRFQNPGGDDQKGGFFYGYGLEGEKKEHLNSWCTMFALQALVMYHDVFAAGRKIDRLERFV